MSLRLANMNAANISNSVSSGDAESQEDRGSSTVIVGSFDTTRENSYRESENTLKRTADSNSGAVSQDNDNAKKLKTESSS